MEDGKCRCDQEDERIGASISALVERSPDAVQRPRHPGNWTKKRLDCTSNPDGEDRSLIFDHSSRCHACTSADERRRTMKARITRNPVKAATAQAVIATSGVACCLTAIPTTAQMITNR